MGIKSGNMSPTAAGSVKADWIVAVSNAAATADSASVLLAPTTSATATPIRIPEGATRVMVRCRYNADATGLTSSPVVRLLGLDRNGIPIRLDNILTGATGQTLTIGASAAGLVGTDWSSADPGGNPASNTSAYKYSDPGSITGTDCLGCEWLYVLRSTAAVVTGGTPATSIVVLFLN